jgi:hypothetical protein
MGTEITVPEISVDHTELSLQKVPCSTPDVLSQSRFRHVNVT